MLEGFNGIAAMRLVVLFVPGRKKKQDNCDWRTLFSKSVDVI